MRTKRSLRLISVVVAGTLTTLGLGAAQGASSVPTAPGVLTAVAEDAAEVAAVRHRQCKQGFVPVTTAKGHRCVRLSLPKITSARQYIQRVAAADPEFVGQAAGAQQHEALARVERLMVNGLIDGMQRASQLPVGAQVAQSAPGATFDTGWVDDGEGELRRTEGSAGVPPGNRIGRTEEVTVTVKNQRGGIWQHTLGMSIALDPCPDKAAKVTGTVTLTDDQISTGYAPDWTPTRVRHTYVTSADIVARVTRQARLRPYDLRGTMTQTFVDYLDIGGLFKPKAPSTSRVGFLDLNIPYRSSKLKDFVPSRYASKQWYEQELGLQLLWMRSEVGPRLQRIEAEWREQKKCVTVLTTPAKAGSLTKGDRRSFVVQARAGGRDITADLTATAVGGVIRPRKDTTRLGGPGRFRFTMGSGSTARITFTATSDRGIGERVIRVGNASTPLPSTMHGTLTEDEHGPWGDRREEFSVALDLAERSDLGGQHVAVYRATGGTWQESFTMPAGDVECSGSSGSGSGTDIDGSITIDWSGADPADGEYFVTLNGSGWGTSTDSCGESSTGPDFASAAFGRNLPIGASASQLDGNMQFTDPDGTRHDVRWSLTGP